CDLRGREEGKQAAGDKSSGTPRVAWSKRAILRCGDRLPAFRCFQHALLPLKNSLVDEASGRIGVDVEYRVAVQFGAPKAFPTFIFGDPTSFRADCGRPTVVLFFHELVHGVIQLLLWRGVTSPRHPCELE